MTQEGKGNHNQVREDNVRVGDIIRGGGTPITLFTEGNEPPPFTEGNEGGGSVPPPELF